MRPTPGQIERARLVALWRRNARYWTYPNERFDDYDPVEVMEGMRSVWPLDDFYNGPFPRPDQYAPNLPVGNVTIGRTRIISNPSRPLAPPPDLELPDDFPY